MLKMVLKKIMLLLGVVLALCAFVLPSVSSAASWSPGGTVDGRIDSGNLGWSITLINGGASCTSSTFSVSVDTAFVATITNGTFANCHGDTGGSVGCTITSVGTFPSPWRMTAFNTSDIIIDEVDIDVSFEQTPGTLGECPQVGLNIRLTGRVTASFTPGAVGARRLDFGPPTTGFFAHFPGVGSLPAVARGQATATGLLNILD